MDTLTLTSPAFMPEGWLPDRFSGFGEDVSPALTLQGLSPKAVTLAVTLDDLGHPIQPGYNHWVAWNLPPVDLLPEGLPRGAAVEAPLHLVQGLAYGRHCYRGPKPPFNWCHRYRFTVYALDTALELSPDADKAALVRAMAGHILQSATLHGFYQRKHRTVMPR